jgi:hypothetical protein
MTFSGYTRDGADRSRAKRIIIKRVLRQQGDKMVKINPHRFSANPSGIVK